MTAKRASLGDFRWDGVPVHAYKPAGDHFRGVTRQVLFAAEPGFGHELRYFELAPGGYTTLERHRHTHQVMVLRGGGRALVGSELIEVAAQDLVRVPPQTWHQFRAADAEPFGILCLVDEERDRPVRPTDAQLARLRANPEVADFIRV